MGRTLMIPIHLFVHLFWGFFWTILIGALVSLIGILKLLLPIPLVQRGLSSLANATFRIWGYAMSLLFQLSGTMQWHINGDLALEKSRWYMIICNHQSWVDILVLMHLSRRHMPMPRFFLKQQLFWIPFVGLGCWALDMPFMKRYSKDKIAKKPHLQGKDIATTRRSCEKFRHLPTTVINFCEGTRFTPEKHQKKHSPYTYLLPPKAGGTAFSLQIMGKQFDAILDITIVYPENGGKPVIWDLLSGRLDSVTVDIETLPVTDDLIGDYGNDPAFRQHFQHWLNQRWQLKDKKIAELKAG
ncbi:acyltransferase [Idiomarina tyrosinivorans]|uniref:Acyltransferase n=1 Tax=Idiomarina tyrosinivorans TaxID=1445662 RepID=A0A432ZSN5_9GAMM|nr:acyltransferase [Idiomarina tyrosinivorans]RUO80917.1 acyltransferase [Idiomarina tyrosinivorans]